MNKEQYIIELRKRLSLLDNKEVDNIIDEYQDYIKQKVNEGKSEKEALEEMGNINDLAKKILTSYKISDKYIKLFIGKEKLIDDINEFVSKISDVSSTILNKIEKSVSEFAKNTKKYGEEKYQEVKNIIKKHIYEDDNEKDEPADEDYEIID